MYREVSDWIREKPFVLSVAKRRSGFAKSKGAFRARNRQPPDPQIPPYQSYPSSSQVPPLPPARPA